MVITKVKTAKKKKKSKRKNNVLEIKEVQEYIKRDNTYKCFTCDQPIFVNDIIKTGLKDGHDISFAPCGNCGKQWYGVMFCNIFSSPDMQEPELLVSDDLANYQNTILI